MATTPTPPPPAPKPEPAAPKIPPPVEVGQLADGTKIMRRQPGIRSCGLKDAKNKVCAGHLKRWFFYGEELKALYGPQAEIYRCENCKAVYLPDESEPMRSGTLRL